MVDDGKNAANGARNADAEIQALLRDLQALQSERDALQAHLIEARKFDSLGCLAGGIVHDFNNVLTVILGCSELALERVDRSNAAWKELTEIRSAAECSAQLTHHLLGYLRKQPAKAEEFDLNERIGATLPLLRRLVGETIALAWSPGIAAGRVCMPPLHVDRMLINLCANARDAMKGRGTIRIATQRCAAFQEADDPFGTKIRGDCALLTVADDGCGMDPAELERICTPLYTTKARAGGTGLGLATVRHVVKLSRGRMAVESVKDMGTKVRIYLPLLRVPAAARAADG